MTPARLSSEIMNIRCDVLQCHSKPQKRAYQIGHGMARHAAAELAGVAYLHQQAELRSILASLDGSPTVLECLFNARERLRGLID